MSKRLFKPGAGGARVLFLPPEQIRPNPGQPRRCFDRESLQELADSIAQHGLLQPICVRRQGDCYELIAGERRLRAARLAGLTEIPCMLLAVDEAQSGMMTLVENLQRKDLDCWEEAEGIAGLIRAYGLSQEEVAERLGKSPSAIANKLRLLKHPPAVRAALRASGLSERHARALLKLPEEAQRLEAVKYIVEKDLTVARTEAYIEALLKCPPAPKRSVKPMKLRDLRLFLNALDRHMETLKQAGIPGKVQRQETDAELILTIRLPKRQNSD